MRIFLGFFIAFLVLGFGVNDAEARRLGGGRSFGMQRQAAPSRQAAPPAAPKSPAATPNAPNRSWVGPLAGLAAGLGLAALFAHLGLSGAMSNMLMMGLLVIAGIFVFRLLTRRNVPTSAPNLANEPMRYAGAGQASANRTEQAPAMFAPQNAAGAAGAGLDSTNATIPADFDSEAFLRIAKLNFVRLQAANDAKNFADIREFVSPEVYAEIKIQMDERGNVEQQTDIVTLNAELLEVVTEAKQYVISVKFDGMIRETENTNNTEASDAPAVPFTEIWHLSKALDHSGGWVVSGIQQV